MAEHKNYRNYVLNHVLDVISYNFLNFRIFLEIKWNTWYIKM